MGSGARAASGSMTAASAAHLVRKSGAIDRKNYIVAEKPCYKQR